MRSTSFGENKLSLLDKIILSLRVRQVSRYLSDCEVLLDAGCGYDAKFLKLARTKFEIKQAIGLDAVVGPAINEVGLKLAACDLNKPFPIEGEIVDCVISAAVIEHLSQPEQYLKEIFRVLKPGGKLILTTPTKIAKPVLEFMAFRLGLINKDEIRDHKNYFNGKELSLMLSTAGFKKEIIARTFTFGFNNFIFCTK